MREYNFNWKYELMNHAITGGTVTLDSKGDLIDHTGGTANQKVIQAARYMKEFMDYRNSVLTLDGYTITANL